MTAIPHPLHPAADHAHDHGEHAHHEIGFVKKYIFSCDHKMIGIQFLFMGLIFFVVGGLLAMLIRWNLAFPDPTLTPGHPVPILGKMLGWSQGYMPPDFYTMVFTMHASIMIFFVIIPLLVGTFGNYLIPLKIGAGDMAFPFLNGLAFWSAIPAGAIMLAGFFMPGNAAAAGWTSYPPLSAVQQNSGSVADVVGNLLQIQHSTWAMAAVITNFLALFMAFMFICAYYVRLGIRGLNIGVSILLSLIVAGFTVRGIQHTAFDGQSAWFLSLFLLGFSSLMGAVNYLTTMVKLRCPGMTMFRMPLSIWSLFITSVLVLLATPVLASALLLNLLDHHRITGFFEPFNWIDQSVGAVARVGTNTGGGYPILHQHLFWFYSHPAVYIMILPAMGMVSDILSVFSRKPIFGYRPMVYAMAGIAFLGFIVWAHHMFQSGMNPTLGTTFAVSTMFIAVPSAIKTFNWLGTLWGGNIRFTVPMLNAIAFVAMFVIGGLSGIFMASTAVDVHIHDTYFIVAHIHYVLFGGSTFGIWAGIYFWYPKMFGRMMNNTLGYIHFVLSFIGFNGTFFAMHILGIGGFPRRVAGGVHIQYPNTFGHFLHMNQFISYSAFLLGAAQIFFIINFIGSWIWGKKAPSNPWEATTLEWNDTTSPPPHGNFTKVPIVHHGPYEYSSPLVEEDWLPQTRYVEGAEKLVVHHQAIMAVVEYANPSVARGKTNRALHGVALATAIATFPLIFMGGLVTSHGAGMSVPDWPNSYGYNMFLFPPRLWIGGILYEHTHRLMGTVVGMLAIALTIVAWRTESRRWVRWLATSVLGAVILQGVLGGLRVVLVKLDLAIVHACFAQAFFCLSALVCVVTSKWWTASRGADIPSSGLLPRLAIIAVVLIYLQLIVGAVMRHERAGLAIPDFPAAYGNVLPPANAAELADANATRAQLAPPLEPVTLAQIWIHFAHRIGAALVTIAILALVFVILRSHADEPAMLAPACTLVVLLAAQVTLGILTVVLRKPADVASLHVAVGALVLVTTFVIAVRSMRLYARHGRLAQANDVRTSESQIPQGKIAWQ